MSVSKKEAATKTEIWASKPWVVGSSCHVVYAISSVRNTCSVIYRVFMTSTHAPRWLVQRCNDMQSIQHRKIERKCPEAIRRRRSSEEPRIEAVALSEVSSSDKTPRNRCAPNERCHRRGGQSWGGEWTVFRRRTHKNLRLKGTAAASWPAPAVWLLHDNKAMNQFFTNSTDSSRKYGIQWIYFKANFKTVMFLFQAVRNDI